MTANKEIGTKTTPEDSTWRGGKMGNLPRVTPMCECNSGASKGFLEMEQSIILTMTKK